MDKAELLTAENIPENHDGIDYCEFLSQLSKKRGTQRYLEIGVLAGAVFSSIHAETAVGVDPAFCLNANIMAHKKRALMIAMTSDAFFADAASVAALGGSPDLTFLDGYHTFEFLLRDFYNTEAISSPRSLVVMHDCLPLNEEMADRSMSRAYERGQNSRFKAHWTGDVWKVIPILQKYRPDLKLVFLDCRPTGLFCVTNLDPTNRVLSERYIEIIEEFAAMPNDTAKIAEMYAAIRITPAAKVVKDFDYSLFFKS